ncbi:NUDIX hydrolase [Ruania zhangjianzhongii]|uniref:NUDIX hydrolase n=1 Tax=Ruania zhangjianzhongii TaxID=2603206 RepID=UPI0011CAD5B1|nr:NUDIX domain-containing protein [Ruania zhangjianzhongii]
MPVPEFISALRRHVGTELLWLSGVSAVVRDEQGRILLGRRADTGRWAVPSGILEPGEQPAQAIVREVLEETGIHAEVELLASVFTGERVDYPNGDQAQYLDLTFRCRQVGGAAVVGDDESLEVGWFAADSLPEPLTESSRHRIDDALSYDPVAGPRFAR